MLSGSTNSTSDNTGQVCHGLVKEVQELPPSSGLGAPTVNTTRDARTIREAKKRMFEFDRVGYSLRSLTEMDDCAVKTLIVPASPAMMKPYSMEIVSVLSKFRSHKW